MGDIESMSHVVERHQKVFVSNLAQETNEIYLVYSKSLNKVHILK